MEIKVEVTPEKVARGRKYAGMLCATCHMDPTTRKLTGKRLADVPPEFGLVFSKNITQDKDKGIGSWTDGELIYFLRTGIDRHGQYVPPYMVKLPHLSDDDLEGIVAFLRSSDPLVASASALPLGSTQPSFLTKFLSHTVFKPLPYPKKRITAPPVAEQVAYGRYLSSSLGCFSCHSADFKTMNELDPEKSVGYMGGGNELRDQSGAIIRSANITFDEETGIGKWSEAEFAAGSPRRRASRQERPALPDGDDARAHGRRCGRPLRVPEDGAEAAARRRAPGAQGSRRRERGQEALLQVRLRLLPRRRPESGLPTCVRRLSTIPTTSCSRPGSGIPGTFKPGTKMPTWEGVIPESEFPVLIAYVKELGKAN